MSYFMFNMNESMKNKFFESMTKVICKTKYNENRDKYNNRQFISIQVQT